MCHELPLTAALVRAAGLVMDVGARAAAEHEVTTQHAQMLCVVGCRPLSMAQLGSALRITKSSTSGLVDRAEEGGLVRRSADLDDRRSQLVMVTDRGAQVGQAYRDTVAKGIEVLVADIPDAEREALRTVLSRIVLDHQARNTWPSENNSASEEHTVNPSTARIASALGGPRVAVGGAHVEESL